MWTLGKGSFQPRIILYRRHFIGRTCASAMQRGIVRTSSFSVRCTLHAQFSSFLSEDFGI